MSTFVGGQQTNPHSFLYHESLPNQLGFGAWVAIPPQPPDVSLAKEWNLTPVIQGQLHVSWSIPYFHTLFDGSILIFLNV